MRLLLALSIVTFASFPAPSACAGLPPPNNSTIPAMISIVGHDANGVPDPIGEFRVVVRDLANNPLAGSMVLIDFGGCDHVRLCADQHDPGATVYCPEPSVYKFTDAAGVATFRIMGWSNATPGGTSGDAPNCAGIYADGVLLGHPNVSIYDLVPSGGLGASDLSAWLADFFANTGFERDDYDNSETVGPNDLSMWLKAFFAAGSIANCSPEGPCP